MAVMMVDAQVAILLRDHAPNEPQLVGWVFSAIAISSVICTYFLYRKFSDIHNYGTMLGIANILIGTWLLWLSFFSEEMFILYPVIGAVIGGAGTALYLTIIPYILQREVPKHMVGRIAGVQDSNLSLVEVLAPLIGGMLVVHYGSSVTFNKIGIFVLLLGIIAISFQKVLWPVRYNKGDG
jgi:DHA3 family macrolide efflux protein-like MFS transporter